MRIVHRNFERGRANSAQQTEIARLHWFLPKADTFLGCALIFYSSLLFYFFRAACFFGLFRLTFFDDLVWFFILFSPLLSFLWLFGFGCVSLIFFSLFFFFDFIFLRFVFLFVGLSISYQTLHSRVQCMFQSRLLHNKAQYRRCRGLFLTFGVKVLHFNQA